MNFYHLEHKQYGTYNKDKPDHHRGKENIEKPFVIPEIYLLHDQQITAYEEKTQ